MFVTEIEKMECVAAREQLQRGMATPSPRPHGVTGLIDGWDYCSDFSEADTTPFGVWRTPHLSLGSFHEAVDVTPEPMLQTGLAQNDLYARFWRLSGLLADDQSARELLAIDADADPGARLWVDRPDFFRPINPAKETARDTIIRSVLGHSLLDGAIFIRDLDVKNSELATLLLAKEFTKAAAQHPHVKEMDWPASCKKHWAKHGGANHLPPFYFLCHLAEFQRLGQNSVAIMRMSFNEDGEELSIRRLKEKIDDTMDMDAENVIGSLDDNIRALLGMCIYQTHALLPEPEAYKTGNADQATVHSNRVSDLLRTNLARTGDGFEAAMTGRSGSKAAALVLQSLANHHDRFPDIATGGPTNRMRGRHEGAVTYWGNDWFDHAAFGLAQLALSVQRHNDTYGKVKLPLDRRTNAKAGRVIGLKQAMVRIVYFWLETANSKAFENQMRGLSEDYDEEKSAFPGAALETLSNEIRTHAISDIWKEARKNQPSDQLGSSAMYFAEPWYDKNYTGDLGWYRDRQGESNASFASLGLTMPFDAVSQANKLPETRHAPHQRIQGERHHKKVGRNQVSTGGAVSAAVAVRDLAMTISTFSADPQLTWMKRKKVQMPM